MFKAQPELGPDMNLSPEYQQFKTTNWKPPGGRLCFKGIEICHDYLCNSVNIVLDFPAYKFMGPQSFCNHSAFVRGRMFLYS